MSAPLKKPAPAHAGIQPLFLTIPLIADGPQLQGVLSEVRVRELMNAPGAPAPILGGQAGALAVWPRDAVVSYLERIAKGGKWPKVAP
ncbi:hypothetical protein WKW79_13695 [Variovorax robiniae]|uniref:CBS domain-containing protein n=1 Tax=Variovorax robiniae TaxID=1836199 RepID=A0ABU8X945_9BURK